MSTPALPTPADAFNLLSTQVHQTAFFGKMASQYGIEPQTEKEAQDLFEMAGNLRAAGVNVSAPAAMAEPSSPIEKAAQQLATELGQNPAEAANEQAIKSACAQLAQDPSFYNAVLSLKADEAEKIAAQLGGNQPQAQA